MTIIRNPRSGTSFEKPDMLCNMCLKTNTYFYNLKFDFKICKGCLTNMIKEIDNAIIADIAQETINEIRN